MGSIGQRHYKNLKSLGHSDVFVYDIADENIFEDVPRVEILDRQTLEEFDIAFICNPTSEHVKTAILCAEAGLHLFIEKPLSKDEVGIDKLIDVCSFNNTLAMVACNYRFHDGFLKTSELIRSGKFGKPLTCKVNMGQDVSASRPGVDYRDTYVAKKEEGGGVLFDSGSHIIDYLRFLFGDVVSSSGFIGRLSNLEIETEDFIAATLVHQNMVVSSVCLDYFGKPKRHRVEINLTSGAVIWDFVKGTVECYSETGKEEVIEIYPNLSKEEMRNAMYLKEIEAFMSLVVGETDDNPQSLADARKTFNVLREIKKICVSI